MTSAMKGLLVVLGLLTAVLILTQLVVGQLMVPGNRPDLLKIHQHTGYTTVVLTIAYLATSMRVLINIPTKEGKVR